MLLYAVDGSGNVSNGKYTKVQIKEPEIPLTEEIAGVEFNIPKDLVYDGDAKEITVKSVTKGNIGKIDYSVKGDNNEYTTLDKAPTDVGDYKISVTVASPEGENYIGNVTIEKEFTIKPQQLKDGDIQIIVPQDTRYTGNSIGIEINMNDKQTTNQVVTYYEIVSGKQEKATNDPPKEPGKYKAVVTVDGTGNYIGTAKAEVEYEIKENNNSRSFQMKDISNIRLYKGTNEGIIEQTSININDLKNLENYIVKLEMKDLPELYTTIKSYSTEGNVLKLLLDYEYNVQYEKNKKYTKLEVEYGRIRNGKATYEKRYEVQNSSDRYIPDIQRLKSLKDYNNKKEIAYSNLYKLMPFYDAEYIILDGRNISESSLLNTKVIKTILPIDAEGNFINILTEENYQKISKIKLVFEDNSVQDYKTRFEEYKGNIVTYSIDELNIKYNYNKYVINKNTSAIKAIADYIQNLNFINDLAPLTDGQIIETYKNYFDEILKKDAINVALELSGNGYLDTITINNNILTQKITQDYITSGELKKILYTYIYYERWYSIKIGEIKVSDLLLFNREYFSELKYESLQDAVISETSNINTNQTAINYANKIAPYTSQKNMGEFIDNIIITFGGYSESTNDWFKENYQGIVEEETNEHRAWEQLKNNADYILPCLTLPKNTIYIVAEKSGLIIGAQKTYITDTEDFNQHENLVKLVSEYTGKEEYSNSGLDENTKVKIDCQYVLSKDGKTYEEQIQGMTEEPFYKEFIEVLNLWTVYDGNTERILTQNILEESYLTDTDCEDEEEILIKTINYIPEVIYQEENSNNNKIDIITDEIAEKVIIKNDTSPVIKKSDIIDKKMTNIQLEDSG